MYIRRFVIGLLILLVVVVVLAATNIYWGIDDAYAQWGATDMTINYMQDNDGAWPPNWEALRPYFEAGGGRVGGWSFAQFQRRVAIDFNANADELQRQSVESDTVPFNVIRARWTFGVSFDDGPNASLHRYFRTQAGIIEAIPPREGWPSEKHKTLADEWYRRGFDIRFDDQGNIVEAWTTLLSNMVPPGDEVLAQWKHHTHLKYLNLVGAQVTDAGLVVIRELPALESLDLSETITDAGLQHLREHPRLESLDLLGTRIIDAGLQALRDIPRLRSVRLDERQISAEAIRELKAAIPNLEFRPQGELRVPRR